MHNQHLFIAGFTWYEPQEKLEMDIKQQQRQYETTHELLKVEALTP